MAQTILKAASVITVDPDGTRAEAVAFDTATGAILGVGSLAGLPDGRSRRVGGRDLGQGTCCSPGFVDAHSHPVFGAC